MHPLDHNRSHIAVGWVIRYVNRAASNIHYPTREPNTCLEAPSKENTCRGDDELDPLDPDYRFTPQVGRNLERMPDEYFLQNECVTKCFTRYRGPPTKPPLQLHVHDKTEPTQRLLRDFSHMSSTLNQLICERNDNRLVQNITDRG